MFKMVNNNNNDSYSGWGFYPSWHGHKSFVATLASVMYSEHQSYFTFYTAEEIYVDKNVRATKLIPHMSHLL